MESPRSARKRPRSMKTRRRSPPRGGRIGGVSRGWILVAVLGGAFAVADAAVGAFWPTPLPPSDVALHVAIGLAWLGAGLVAWARRPELRIGPLMAAVGIAWYWETPWWLAPLPQTLGFLLENIALAAALHAVLAFPTGRLQTRFERGLVAAAYATVLVTNLIGNAVFDPLRDDCTGCADNLLLIHHSAAVRDVVSVIEAALAVVLGGIAAWVLARRWHGASAPARRVLGPVVLAAAG